ncbi:protein Mpv17 [Oryza brachyantha]|uniref:protein Mpv17 n=1 Tax=Oryza brachyantha TaxID=4533 RepID=UPI0003EAA6FC|nr:protein Mpv17 [Oryza brachyantha]
MRRLWRWYQQCLATHPVRTQVVSSGVLWGLGDIGAQAVTHYSRSHRAKNTEDKDKEFKIDWKRVGITSSFGFAFVGPVGHYWYEYLDRFILRRYQPKTFKFVASKVAADGLLFGPVDLLLFFSYVGLASGRSVDQVKDDVKRDFVPALVLGGTVWPAVQIANFRFIPVRYQLLYVNLFCLLDSCFLSWIEQQGDAPWKQWFTSFQKIEGQKGKV